MKVVLTFLLVLVSSIGWCQKWRDSLDVARSSYKKGDYKKALKYYESAQKNAPEEVDLSDEMGQSAYKAREFEQAEKIYQQNTGSKHDAKSRSKNLHNLGNSRMKTKNYQGAIEAYKEALKNNPKDKKTKYNLSEAIRRQKEQRKKEQQQQPQQDQQDQQQQDSGQSQDQAKNQQQNQQSQNQQQSDGQNQQQNQGGEGSESKDQGKGSLPNKTVERMLDDLMKKEAETKRRMSGNGGGGKNPKSGKDW